MATSNTPPTALDEAQVPDQHLPANHCQTPIYELPKDEIPRWLELLAKDPFAQKKLEQFSGAFRNGSARSTK